MATKAYYDAQYQKRVEQWLRGEISGLRGQNTFAVCSFVRRYLREKYGDKCQRCGWNEKHPISGEVPLEIHHSDGNFFNNTETNIQLLCPNCHSLTSTYRARNKGNGRDRRVRGA